ncbi:DUF6249 domain-containing protein [Hymenobacter coccineus]|uniref:DUF6249 domain-containing protein n=1 Tax=Hymenobacter coccineus TaxID=1908235 RepID=A0A1G1TGI1_9BACT|nr:DUF6249 domain-containing protein [Hymenobacter coccineus]OGX89990.1 hypothetical protein BEN49_24165 [Hymenobacter coccineus]
MENSFAAAIPVAISVTLSGFGIAYYYLTTRSRERLALIEKGLAISSFAQPTSYLPLLLLLGVLSMGIAVGIVAGAGLTTLVGSQSYVYPVTIFFFAGLSLVVAYHLLKALPAPK